MGGNGDSSNEITDDGAVCGDEWFSSSDISVISGPLAATAASAIRLALIASLWERNSASAMFAGSITLLDACWVRFGRGADGTDGMAFAIEVTL